MSQHLPLALLLIGTSGAVATLAPHTAEIYPTDVRGSGGFTAACCKAGGLFAPPLIGLLLAQHPGMRVIALCATALMAAATVAMALKGRETAGRELEEARAAPATVVRQPVGDRCSPAGVLLNCATGRVSRHHDS